MPVSLAGAYELPPQSAIAFLERKAFRARGAHWNWWDTWEGANAHSFVVARVTRLQVLVEIREAVERALREGVPERQFVRELRPRLQALGWWGQEIVVGPDGGAEVVRTGSVHRLRTILRVNLQTAYMAGRWRQQLANAESRPFLQYVAVMDARTRPAHAAMHGKVFRIDDPIWQWLYPPNGWNCRCRVRALTAAQVERLGLKVESSAGHLQRIMQEVGLDKRTGEIIERPGMRWRGTGADGKPLELLPDAGWSYNPGMAWADRELWTQAREALGAIAADAELLEVVRDARWLARWAAWVDEVLARGKPYRDAQVAGYVLSRLRVAMEERGQVAATGAIMVPDSLLVGAKARRHQQRGDALSATDWKRLPELLTNPQAVLFDLRKRNVLYVFHAGEGDRTAGKIVVAFDSDVRGQPAERVEAAFRVSFADLDGGIRGGQYQVLQGEIVP